MKVRSNNAMGGFTAQSKADFPNETKTEYAIRVMAEDTMPDGNDQIERVIETVVFSGNGCVLDDWARSEFTGGPELYDTHREYIEHARKKEQARAEWTDRILKLLGWSDGSIYYNFGGVFTAIRIVEAQEAQIADNSYTITE